MTLCQKVLIVDDNEVLYKDNMVAFIGGMSEIALTISE